MSTRGLSIFVRNDKTSLTKGIDDCAAVASLNDLSVESFPCQKIAPRSSIISLSKAGAIEDFLVAGVVPVFKSGGTVLLQEAFQPINGLANFQSVNSASGVEPSLEANF